jgi:DnaJ-class molecular chaperone
MARLDYYSILGVARTASKRDIQAAYRKLARKFHPDVTGGDKSAEDRFKAINHANDVLSDGKKRAAYDKWGDQWEQADQLEATQRQSFGPGGFRFSTGRSPFADEDTFGGGGLGDVFERLFARGGSARTRATRGQDIQQPVTVSLAEAYSGTTRTLQFQSQEPCDTCGGSGQIGDAICHTCTGRGLRTTTKRLEVTVPPGVENGTRIRLRGKGGAGTGGGPAGDAVLIINVADDARFERRGSALHTDLAVPLTTAVLGGEVRVPTVTGEVALTIPEATQNGRIFRLGGQGMPVMKGDQRGDLFAKIRVVLPEVLNDEQRRFFEALQALEKPGDSAAQSAASANAAD